jgi:hypothetical protein
MKLEKATVVLNAQIATKEYNNSLVTGLPPKKESMEFLKRN